MFAMIRRGDKVLFEFLEMYDIIETLVCAQFSLLCNFFLDFSIKV